MDDAALSALKAAFGIATSWNEWATIVVVVGVVIEFLALLIFGKEMSRAEQLMLIAGSLLVVGGVGGEYVFGSRAAHIATELQQQSDQAVAGLQAQQEADHKTAAAAAAHAADLGVTIDNLHAFVERKTADADARLSEFKSYADDQKKRNDAIIAELQNDETRLGKARDDALAAAQASAITLDKMNAALDAERAVRQQMISVITPRTVNSSAIKAQLSTFSPMKVGIFTFGDTKEITDFGRVLSDALQLAGWNSTVWAEMNGASAGVTGVPIVVRPGADANVSSAAKALETALHAQQISAAILDPPPAGAFNGANPPGGGVMGSPWDAKNAADLFVFVGAKP